MYTTSSLLSSKWTSPLRPREGGVAHSSRSADTSSTSTRGSSPKRQNLTGPVWKPKPDSVTIVLPPATPPGGPPLTSTLLIVSP